MGLGDRLLDGLRATIELRGDLDRAVSEIKRASDLLLDHEKRLVRLETIAEMRGEPRGPRLLPGPDDA